MSEQRPLVLVSNRGPVTFQEDGSVKRGTGGLVTALTGLASHRDAVWIASALTEGEAEKAREESAKPFSVRSPAGGEYHVRLVASEPDAYDRFYNIFANPMLWFIQHYLWDLSNAPDVRRNEIERSSTATTSSTRTSPTRSSRRSRARTSRSSWSTTTTSIRCPSSSGARGRTCSCTTSCTSRGRSPTRGGCCRTASARRSTRASSPTTSSAFTRRRTGATSCSAAAT